VLPSSTPRNGGHAGAPFRETSNTPLPLVAGVHGARTVDHRRPARTSRSMPVATAKEDPSAIVELAALAKAQPQTVYRNTMAEPMAFGSSFLSAHERKRRLDFRQVLDLKPRTLAQIAVTAAVGVVVVVVIYMVTGRDGSDADKTASAPPAATGKAAPAAPAATAAAAAQPGPAPSGAPVTVDPASGFDLIVDPAGVKIKLDGRPIGKAPLQIRNLIEGNHLVEVEAPPGFFDKSQTVQVARGKAQRVVMKLDAMDVIGKFTSEPTGARVTLLVDGEKRSIGVTPVEARLDPRKRYDVVFRRDGFEPATRVVSMTGGDEVQVAAVLDRAGKAPAGGNLLRAGAPAAKKARPVKENVVETEEAAEPVGEGMLGLMSKPPCRIFIDGRDIGQKTPQVGIKLKAGRHRVTLVNNEFGLKESFVVEIQAGETVKAIRDLTDRIQPGSVVE
jgi:hypothetical protein